MSQQPDRLPFEEAFRVIKVSEHKWVGAHPLRLPIIGARGVYGGHTCAQTLLVAMESAPGYIPHSFHSYFIGAGSARLPMEYEVENLHDGNNYTMRSILVKQKGRVRYSALVSLVKEGHKLSEQPLETQFQPTRLHYKYSDPEKLEIINHTDYIRNAYSPEFKDFRETPEENDLAPSKRWVTVWSGVNNGTDTPRSPMKDPRFNYIGLADLSDSALLTTLIRILHLDWNPTVDNPYEDFDEHKNAEHELMKNSLNMLHIFHYNAMSLDHHIYFHLDNFKEPFDVCRDWLTLCYQAKTLSNNRTLMRGCMFNKEGQCVATVIQEGLTFMFPGVADKAKM